MIEINGWQGHIVLFCKHHYGDTSNLIEKLKMIWAIRYGYPYNKNNNSSLRNIASELYDILKKMDAVDDNFQDLLHQRLCDWFYKDLPAIENIIIFYAGRIMGTQIKQRVNKYYKTLIKLPTPKKKLFNRILSGKGRFEDYKLVA